MKLFGNFSLSIFFLILLPQISSCSSISKEDCKKNMRDFGFDLGLKGQNNLIDDVRKTCSRIDNSIDLNSFQNGFEAGWNQFCTPFNGYRMGIKGDNYKSFCPTMKESLFHERFLIGKKVFEKKDQARELQEKIMDLSEDGKNLTTPSVREELIRYKMDLTELNKEIQDLEQQGMSNVHLK